MVLYFKFYSRKTHEGDSEVIFRPDALRLITVQIFKPRF